MLRKRESEQQVEYVTKPPAVAPCSNLLPPVNHYFLILGTKYVSLGGPFHIQITTSPHFENDIDSKSNHLVRKENVIYIIEY